ncbi:MAG: indole-3-glycerol-phosphate synthase, partial [Fretibacterium sp.]|nr:indole-3-glycerol-phosphate synthase [Fretibacterium sp.]
GSDEYLREIAAEVGVPCLRKDFTVDEYMICEAKLFGAAAVLLIVSLLGGGELRRFIEICDGLGLSALVEAHDEGEIRMALDAGARVIGVNNRNLKDFSVDVGNSGRLRSLVPEGIIFVAESGIQTAEEVEAMRRAGVNAVLVGTALMSAPDKRAALNALRGGD